MDITPTDHINNAPDLKQEAEQGIYTLEGFVTTTPISTGNTVLAEAGPKASASETSQPVFSVPDGGLEAWSVVFGGWLILFSTFGCINAFGVYEDHYLHALGQSPSSIAWIGSFQLFMQFLSGIATGKLFDEGHGRLLQLVGTSVYVFALFMTSLCKQYWQIFLAQGVLGGLGVGMLFLPAVSTIPQWFKRKRALATGIVISGSSLGGIVFPIMLNNLFKTIGFASAVRASVYVILGCLLLALLLVKQRIPGRKHRPTHMHFPAPDIHAIMRHRAYWLSIAGGFFIAWGIFFPQFYIQVFAQSHGLFPNLSFYTLSIVNAASVFGRVLPNFLADYFGVFNLLVTSSAACGIVILCWIPATSTPGVIVFAILYGFFSGAFISLSPGCFQALSTHVGEVGFRLGIAYAIVAFAALTGTPISGALLGDTVAVYVWWKPILWSGMTTLAGSSLFAIARTMHSKATGKSWV